MTDTKLNLAVAKACGIEVHAVVGGGFILRGSRPTGLGGMPPKMWNPVKSWNDAMEAASLCKSLFHLKLQCGMAGSWFVYPNGDMTNRGTGPRAICEAILATKGGE